MHQQETDMAPTKTHENIHDQTKTNWKALVFYVLTATILSGIFREGNFDFYNTPNANIVTVLAFVVVFIGGGPAIAALLSWKLFGRQNRTVTFLGTWPLGAVVISVLPALVFAVIGYPNDFGMNPHVAGGLIGGLLFLYALGEEIGWRGYMHDALTPRPFWLRAVIIAPVWMIWHLWFLEGSASLAAWATGFGFLLVAAFFLSWLVSESRSLLSSAGFHCVANIGFLASIIDMPSSQRLKIAGIAFGLMVIIHHVWKKKTRLNTTLNGETS
jgi:membrane protease YdiL (CAAX protease family)